jgi:mannitol/fructose-specific phosphotransferase system IIA component (Ntr-type)/biotin operon repressor
LDYLLQVEDPVSTGQIASHLELSPAQVRYSFRYIQSWLHARNVEFIKKPRVGVAVEASVVQREALLTELQQLQGYDLVLTPGERRQFLLLWLLTARSFLPRNELREKLGVSRTTIFRDLAWTREWLQRRGLQLTTHRRRGVLVAGEERLWREAILELLLTNLGQGVFVTASAASNRRSIEQKAVSQSFLREACDFLSSLNLRRAERLVTSLEKRLQLVFVDEARVDLILCLSLLTLRVSMERLVSNEESGDLHAVPQDIERAVRETAKEIEEVIGRGLPVGELRYLAGKIMKAVETGSIVEGQLVSARREPESCAVNLATLLTREAARYLHAGLLHDQELINCLAWELSMLPSHWSPSVSVTNRPSWNTSDAADPLYGFTCRMLSPVLKGHRRLPTDRLLTSIAMHLGTALERLGRTCARRRVWVICGAGVATARNLISRLNLHLPELEVLGVASAFELARDPQLASSADAIVSTIPLDWVTDVPLIHIGPLLTPQDVEKLRVALGLNRCEPGPAVGSWSENGLSMVEILSLQAIDRDAIADSWEGVVDRAGALLLKVGAIWPSYVEAMKDMIRLYGPYVVVAPGAALLHAGPEMGAKRLAMSLVVLHKPIPFGHEFHDPVRLALAFSSVDHKTHVQAVDEAMKLLGAEDRRRSILEASSEREILENIRQAEELGVCL